MLNYRTGRNFLEKYRETHGSVFKPILHLLYTTYLWTTCNNILATFSDDTAVLVSHKTLQLLLRIYNIISIKL